MIGTLSIRSGPAHVVPMVPDEDFESELFVVGAESPPEPVDARAFLSGNLPEGATALVVTDRGLLVRALPGTSVVIERGRRRRIIPVANLLETPLREDDVVVVRREGEDASFVYEPNASLTLPQALFFGLAHGQASHAAFILGLSFLAYVVVTLGGARHLNDATNGRTAAMLDVVRTSSMDGEYRPLDKGISSTLKAAFKAKFVQREEGK
jgi:hypothetical protein